MKVRDSQNILQPAERSRKVFYISLGAHTVLVFVPLLLMLIMKLFEPAPPEDLTVNLVDEPSTGPVVAAQTTRLPPAPRPEENVNPPPVPPTPAPPEPELPDVMPVPAPPEPELTDLPTPPVPKRPKVPPEPKLQLPKVVKTKKPAVPPDTDRTLRNTRRVGVRTGSQTNKDIAIGKKDAAQRYGEKFSNTPDGGRRNEARYTALLGAFLKMRWTPFVPARAQLGDDKPEVVVFLSISGDGKLQAARIEKPSGNPAMDNAVLRLLETLKTQSLPKSPDGKPWSSRVIFDTNG